MPGTVKRVTASGQLTTGSGTIFGIGVIGEGTVGTIVFYDNTAASGTILWELETSTYNSPALGGLNIAFSTGIYVDIDSVGTPRVYVNYG